jgi:hypothetical protein
LFADALRELVGWKKGLNELDKATLHTEPTAERWSEVGMYRVRGELLIAVDDFGR